MDKNILLHLFHILIAGTLFLYVGIRQTKIPEFMYTVLLISGIVVFLYHSFRIYTKANPWVNYIHVFVVAPLLLYVGLYKKKTERRYFEIMLMLGFAAIGYHAYYLLAGH
jgi:uncharacterized membrane protein SirB2